MTGFLAPRELLRIQLSLQCIGVETDNVLTRIPGADPDGIPRYYVARFPDGTYETFFAREVPVAARTRLAGLPADTAFANPATIERILAGGSAGEEVWTGVSYTVPGVAAPAEYRDVVRLTPEEHSTLVAHYDPELTLDGRAAFAIIREGRIAASCVSSRENAMAGEAWVRTEEAYRGQGLARQVTAAWGAALRLAGKVAFYSHHIENVGSAGVARSLGLHPFVRDVGYL